MRQFRGTATWTTLDSMVGPLQVAVCDDGSLVRVSFETTAENFVDQLLGDGWSPVSQPMADGTGTTFLDRVALQIEEYFDGRRKRFELPVDLTALNEFQRGVLAACAAIPFGNVSSYGDLAATIGRPGAARAVGNALGGNPVAIVIPCHRVIAAGGRIGGFGGGRLAIAIKRRLLAVEGVAVR